IAAALGPIALIGGGVISFFLTLASLLALVARFGKGALAVTGAALGVTGATAGAAGAGAAAATTTGAAGAAAGASAATKGGGFFRAALRRAGWIGLGITAYEIADYFGYGLGGKGERVGPEATPEEGRANDVAEWLERQAAIDARLEQIEKNMHPSMRDMPNPERDLLQTERVLLEQQINAATPPGDPAGGAA